MGAPSPTLNLLSKLIRYLELNTQIPFGVGLEKAQEGQAQAQQSEYHEHGDQASWFPVFGVADGEVLFGFVGQPFDLVQFVAEFASV